MLSDSFQFICDAQKQKARHLKPIDETKQIFLHSASQKDYLCGMKLDKRFQIHSNSLDPKQGDILISEPLMNNFHFGRSVVLLVDHSEADGTFGVIVNKQLDVSVNQLVDDFPDFDAPIYLGGPVAEDQIFFMHTLGNLIPDACKIMEGLYWGGDNKTLDTLIATGIANEDNVRFFLGYSGWESGQLVGELVRNSWLVSHVSTDRLLTTTPSKMWETYVNKLGKDYEMWNRFPMNAEDN